MLLIHQLSLKIAGAIAADRKAQITTELLRCCAFLSCPWTSLLPSPQAGSPQVTANPMQSSAAKRHLMLGYVAHSPAVPEHCWYHRRRQTDPNRNRAIAQIGSNTHQWESGCIAHLPAALVQRCTPSQMKHRPGHNQPEWHIVAAVRCAADSPTVPDHCWYHRRRQKGPHHNGAIAQKGSKHASAKVDALPTCQLFLYRDATRPS